MTNLFRRLASARFEVWGLNHELRITRPTHWEPTDKPHGRRSVAHCPECGRELEMWADPENHYECSKCRLSFKPDEVPGEAEERERQ